MKHFAVLKSLREKLSNVFLLDASRRTDARVAAVIEHWLGDFRDSGEVPLLVFLFILCYDVGQLYVAMIGCLACIGKSFHLFYLLLKSQSF